MIQKFKLLIQKIMESLNNFLSMAKSQQPLPETLTIKNQNTFKQLGQSILTTTSSGTGQANYYQVYPNYYQPIQYQADYQPLQRDLDNVLFMTENVQLVKEENDLRYYNPTCSGVLVLALDTHKFYQAECTYIQPQAAVASTSINALVGKHEVKWREVLINQDGSLVKLSYLTTAEEEKDRQKELDSSKRSKEEVNDIFQEFEKNLKVKLTSNQKEQNYIETQDYPPDISGGQVSSYVKTNY